MFPFRPDPDNHWMPPEQGRDGEGPPYDIPGEWREFHGVWQTSAAAAAYQDAANQDAAYQDDAVDEIDEALVDRVAERLVAEAEIGGHAVLVIVQNRVVILEGSVDSTDVKAAAGRLAWATPGVFDVCNMLSTDR